MSVLVGDVTGLGGSVVPGGTVASGDVTVAVVVCCHTDRRWPQLCAAVDGVLAQTRRPDEFVVVVDHDPRLARRLLDRYPELSVVANDRPRGVSGARNAGVAATSGDVVVFLDDDAVPPPGWVAAIAGAFAAPDVIGVGGWIEPAWETRRPSWLPREFDWVVGCSHIGLPADGGRIRNATGANMAVRRFAVDAVGGFDERAGRVGANGLGCEETELFIRVGRRYPTDRVVLCETAAVRHHVPADRTRLRYFVARCWGEGRSKAAMTARTGAIAGLSSERRYVRSVLPRGWVRGVADGFGGDPAGFGRAAAIVLGLTATAAGYAAGVVAGGLRWRS